MISKKVLSEIVSKYSLWGHVEKVKWVYLKDNPYKIDTIGFLDFDLPKPIRKFIEEYVDIPKSFDTILKNKLESFYEDLGWGKLTLNTYVQQFFQF